MKKLQVDLVMVDFDDTLVLTEEATFKLENAIARSMGFPPMSREIHQKTFGVPVNIAIATRIPGIDVEEFMRLVKKEVPRAAARGELDVVTPKNLAVLDELIKRGKKIGILTSRDLGEVEHLLDPDHHLNGRFEKFYHKGMTKYFKPDPRVFADPIKDFGILPEKAVYIGDSPGDGVAAKGANLYFIACMEAGSRKKDDFSDIKVDYFVKQFSDILDIII